MTGLDELVELARDRAAAGRRYLLGITGAPGAGKSTVATQIVDSLGPETAVLVGMDGFHLAQQVLRDLGREERKGAFDTFDADGCAALLARITHPGDEPVYAPEFRREIEEPIGSAVAVRPEVPLVVTEGNYLLLDRGGWSGVRQHLDEVWFLDTDEGVRRQRLIARHRSFGRTLAQAVGRADGSDQVNAELIRTTMAAADRIITIG